jgi:GR25 family glycosyltransferase involved in LPS biosynthesis
MESKQKIETWPAELSPIHVISIRPDRYLDLKLQTDGWGLKLFPGTDGNQINKEEWIRSGKLSQTSTMKRGEIGCFDSHFRLWQHFVKSKSENDCICIVEDDVALEASSQCGHGNKIEKIWKEANEVTESKIELLYFIHDSTKSEKPVVSPNLQYPRQVTTMGYILTRKGAEKLIHAALPFERPVDCFMEKMCDDKVIYGLAMYPALCYVRPLSSDTQNIL